MKVIPMHWHSVSLTDIPVGFVFASKTNVSNSQIVIPCCLHNAPKVVTICCLPIACIVMMWHLLLILPLTS